MNGHKLSLLRRTPTSMSLLIAVCVLSVQPQGFAEHSPAKSTILKVAEEVTPASLDGAPPEQAPLRLVWKRTPLTIGMPVGKERMITFPIQVRLGLPPAIAGLVRVQVVDKTVYLYASAPFEQTRLVAENPSTGTVYLLDVSAKKLFTNSAPVEIFEEKTSEAGKATQEPKAIDAPDEAEEPDMVALTRHAAQQVYAPRRLIRALPGVRPIALDPTPRRGFYRLAAIRAEPIGSWKSASLYITAVKLTNQSSAPIELDPRALRGRWVAATFQHGRLLPHGNEEDTTVVYLISERRFDESF